MLFNKFIKSARSSHLAAKSLRRLLTAYESRRDKEYDH
jgi:hypothetical protein